MAIEVTSGPEASAATGEVGLFDMAGRSAAQVVTDAEAEARDLAAQLRRSYRKARNYHAAATSEPHTAAALAPLTDQGWRILHDRRWPGSTTKSNVDHVAIGPGGVFVLDTKNWSAPVQVRAGRLWHGEDDCHDDTVDTILRLTEAVQDLLIEIAGSDPGLDVGLSPINVTPVLVFTHHHKANAVDPQIGRVWLTTLTDLPVRLARRRCLTPEQVALIGEYLARDMAPTLTVPPTPAVPEARRPVDSPSPVRGVPINARPAPPPSPPPPPEPLFDLTELAEQLTRAAAQPIADWMGFLHPTQARLVRRTFTGPARVRGPAGTGKTVVLLHRAAWLASIGLGRILVTSYLHTLPTQLSVPYARLSPDTADRVDFRGLHDIARQLLAANRQTYPVHRDRVAHAFERAWAREGRGTPLEQLAGPHYWREEINHVIKGRGLREVDQYEAADRPGRGLPLSHSHKQLAWNLHINYQEQLHRAGTYDYNDQLSAALHLVIQQPPDPGWSAVLVDEVQDLSLLGLRLCKALAGDRPNALFLVGDGQQALYPGGFTLADAGITVTGRAVVLRTNYRNTRPIIDTARALVAERRFHDLDTHAEPGNPPLDILRDGAAVQHEYAPHPEGLMSLLHLAIRRHHTTGLPFGEMAVLTHTADNVRRLRAHLAEHAITTTPLDHWTGHPDSYLKIGTVHRSKGLDFAVVFAVDLESAPDQPGPGDRLHSSGAAWRHDHPQRQYVAYTRARDHLWIGEVRRPRLTSSSEENYR